MRIKKMLSAALSAAMVLGTMAVPALAGDVTKGYGDVDLPAAPDMSGNVINVTNANAQYTLDGAYGNINNKTINFTTDITEVLDLARPTKYEGSGTRYYHFPDNNEIQWSEDISSKMNGASKYQRKLSNVTFTANSGVKVKGFDFRSESVAKGYDYVRDIAVDVTDVAYYKSISLENITFTGLTFTGRFYAKLYQGTETVNGVTFDNCTFTAETDNGVSEKAAAIKFLADSQYFTNITVKDCDINNYSQETKGYYQGIYISGVDGATLTRNNIIDTNGNAIALQSTSAPQNPAKGVVTVAENFISGAGDRAIRINYIDEAQIAINNNIMVESGDGDGQLIKATSIIGSGSVNLDANYWSGNDTNTAVAGALTPPKTVGITGGTFKQEIKPEYINEDYSVKQVGSTYTVIPDKESGTLADGVTVKTSVENNTYKQVTALTTSVSGDTMDFYVTTSGENDTEQVNREKITLTGIQYWDGAVLCGLIIENIPEGVTVTVTAD